MDTFFSFWGYDEHASVESRQKGRIATPLMAFWVWHLLWRCYLEYKLKMISSKRIIFSDESTYRVAYKVNKQNCRIWGSENLLIVKEVKINSANVNVWCALKEYTWKGTDVLLKTLWVLLSVVISFSCFLPFSLQYQNQGHLIPTPSTSQQWTCVAKFPHLAFDCSEKIHIIWKIRLIMRCCTLALNWNPSTDREIFVLCWI